MEGERQDLNVYPLAAFPMHAESPQEGGGWAGMAEEVRVAQVPRLH